MQNFIIEFKNALSPDYCQQLIKKFEQSQSKEAGRTGSGIDKKKKNKDKNPCFFMGCIGLNYKTPEFF